MAQCFDIEASALFRNWKGEKQEMHFIILEEQCVCVHSRFTIHPYLSPPLFLTVESIIMPYCRVHLYYCWVLKTRSAPTKGEQERKREKVKKESVRCLRERKQKSLSAAADNAI